MAGLDLAGGIVGGVTGAVEPLGDGVAGLVHLDAHLVAEGDQSGADHDGDDGNDDVLDGVGAAGDLTGIDAIADGIHGNSPSFVSIRTVTETLYSVVPRRSATHNFSAGDSGIDCYMIHPRGTPVQSQTSRKGPMGTRLLRVISFAR